MLDSTTSSSSSITPDPPGASIPDPYKPQPGDRVRVTFVAPWNRAKRCKVGYEFVVDDAWIDSNTEETYSVREEGHAGGYRLVGQFELVEAKPSPVAPKAPAPFVEPVSEPEFKAGDYVKIVAIEPGFCDNLCFSVGDVVQLKRYQPSDALDVRTRETYPHFFIAKPGGISYWGRGRLERAEAPATPPAKPSKPEPKISDRVRIVQLEPDCSLNMNVKAGDELVLTYAHPSLSHHPSKRSAYPHFFESSLGAMRRGRGLLEVVESPARPKAGDLVEVVALEPGWGGRNEVGDRLKVAYIEANNDSTLRERYPYYVHAKKYPETYNRTFRGDVRIVESPALAPVELPPLPPAAPAPVAPALPADAVTWDFKAARRNVDVPRILREADEAKLTYFVLTIDDKVRTSRGKRNKLLFVKKNSDDAKAIATDRTTFAFHEMFANARLDEKGTFQTGSTRGYSTPTGWLLMQPQYNLDAALKVIRDARDAAKKADREDPDRVRLVVTGETA